jgi:hypothetical protein
MLRHAERQRWFGESFHIPGDEAMGGKINDAVFGQRRVLDGGFVGIGTEMDVGGGYTEIFGDRL